MHHVQFSKMISWPLFRLFLLTTFFVSTEMRLATSFDKELFDECASCFAAIAKKAVYLGDVGNAGKLKTVLNLMDGVAMAGLAEAMALTEQVGYH